MKMLETIRETIDEFCLDFVAHPYLCYTEHGQHALFYTKLYNRISKKQRYITYKHQRVCIIQKEYPTAGKLGKPQRQHWDIAVLNPSQEGAPHKVLSYDYLKLFAVIEFGMNESQEHLQDDIQRLYHPDANLVYSFIVHLYRLSESGNLFSGRDWSSKSHQIMAVKDIRLLSASKPVEIYMALTDSTRRYSPGAWHIRDGIVTDL
jgi:hypothetical protein